MAGFDTGISLMADRKSTKENKRVSFALMILGWYANDTKDAVVSDMEVLEKSEEIIFGCCMVKKIMVENDEFDRGDRMILNFGHTKSLSLIPLPPIIVSKTNNSTESK